jgi:hypothetical protein
MNGVIGFVVALAAAGAVAGCAQTPEMSPGMMMGHMPMMMMGRPADAAQMDKMMAMCMEHMQAMSGPRGGAMPSQPQPR